MQKNLLPSISKLIVYLFIAASVSFVIKTIVLSRLKEKDIFHAVYKPTQSAGKSFYFIGTSRMKCAINDSALKESFPQFGFFNTGLGYGTFISNALLATKLMNSIDSAVIFIELSIANGRMPYTFSLTSDPANTVTAIWPLVKTTTLEDLYNIYGPFAENYFIDYINPKPYLKLVSGNYQLNDFFGQMKKYETLQYNPGTILTDADFRQADSGKTEVPSSYHTILQELLAKAKQTNSHIFFSLPIAISNPEERKRLFAIYKILPQRNKLLYSSSFLKKINNPAYLADEMHLNVQGADIYTNYIKEILPELLNRF